MPVLKNQKTAWQAILKLLQRDLTEDQMALLACGPLEMLLTWHGAAFIDRVAHEAGQNPRFNHLLGGVWCQNVPPEIWDRIERTRKTVW